VVVEVLVLVLVVVLVVLLAVVVLVVVLVLMVLPMVVLLLVDVDDGVDESKISDGDVDEEGRRVEEGNEMDGGDKVEVGVSAEGERTKGLLSFGPASDGQKKLLPIPPRTITTVSEENETTIIATNRMTPLTKPLRRARGFRPSSVEDEGLAPSVSSCLLSMEDNVSSEQSGGDTSSSRPSISMSTAFMFSIVGEREVKKQTKGSPHELG